MNITDVQATVDVSSQPAITTVPTPQNTAAPEATAAPAATEPPAPTDTAAPEGTDDSIVKNFPGDYNDALNDNNVPHLHFVFEGGHDGKVYKPGMYNFFRRIFHSAE